MAELALKEIGAAPHSLLEIGSSLGRTYYELTTRFPSIELADLIEPSENLRNAFQCIFQNQVAEFHSIYGNEGFHRKVSVRTNKMNENYQRIKTNLHSTSVEEFSFLDNTICWSV